MISAETKRVALVGAGLIGRSWAIVFACAGWEVRMFDASGEVRRSLTGLLRAGLSDLASHGLCDDIDGTLRRICVCNSVEEAVENVALVQESLPEKVDVKREVFAALDRIAPMDVILASSTSAIVASRFTEGLAGRHRCLVAHPVNPPHLVPLVELCPAPWTDEAVLERARTIYNGVGQSSIVVGKEVEGFVLNRLQGALLTEALRMVSDGVTTPQDVDKAVKDGLGIRWSFMGPFETIELNAPGGIADYAGRYGQFYANLASNPADPSVWQLASMELLLSHWPRSNSAQMEVRRKWRDELLASMASQRKLLSAGE